MLYATPRIVPFSARQAHPSSVRRNRLIVNRFDQISIDFVVKSATDLVFFSVKCLCKFGVEGASN